MHLLGSLIISFMFYDLYGAFLYQKDICDNPYSTLKRCRVDAAPNGGFGFESYILLSSSYIPLCEIRTLTEVLECYSNVTNHCPDWQYNIDYEWHAWHIRHFNTFIIGACLNINVFDDGLRCLGSKRKCVLDFVNRNCLTNVEWGNQTSPRMTMKQYCIRVNNGIQCSVNKAREFGCSDEFYDFLLHSSYVHLPEECFESNSTKMKWLYMYTEIPTQIPERQNRTKESNTCTTTDDVVSSAAWNYMSHVSKLKLNLILYLLQAV